MKSLFLFLRYVFLLIISLGNLWIFYEILTPLTINVLYFILSFFGTVDLSGSVIYFSDIVIRIIPACVAGSAFFLLFILIFSTAGIPVKKRIWMTVLAVVSLFVLNIVRILLLISIVGQSYFDVVHWIFWNLVSVVFVVGIWFWLVRLFDVSETPFWSDFVWLRDELKAGRKGKKRHSKGKKHAKGG